MEDLNKILIEGLRLKNKRNSVIPQHDELLLCLDRLYNMMTGRIDIDFCNSFIREAIQLLINSIFLYEDGNFDCAFYSIRQASEVANNMLYLSCAEKAEFSTWKSKGKFPMNSQLIKKLKRINCNYAEVNNALPDFFAEHDKLISDAHKIIHKQGFDTFYAFRTNVYAEKFDIDTETKKIIKLLKSSIGKVIILFIVLEPLGLVLADDDLSARVHFDPITEAVEVEFFERYLSKDIISKIKGTSFYQEFSNQFAEKELMTPATFDVVRNNGFNIDALEEIEKQKHLLDKSEKVILEILQQEIKISRIYPDCETLCGYFTTIPSKYNELRWDCCEYEKYIKSEEIFNQPYKNVYRSIVNVFSSNWIFEHNEPLVSNQIDIIKTITENHTQTL